MFKRARKFTKNARSAHGSNRPWFYAAGASGVLAVAMQLVIGLVAPAVLTTCAVLLGAVGATIGANPSRNRRPRRRI